MKTEFKTTYIEIQQFRQLWIWLLIIVTGLSSVGVFAYGFYEQIILGQTFGNKPMSDNVLTISFVGATFFFILLVLLFVYTKLTTMIDDSGISYKFFPFHLSFHKITWDQIESYEVITYKPIREYGGWGIRFGWNKKAYNVSGNIGLSVQLKTGKKVLFGTQKEKELKDFLEN
ncbi:MAG: hypothetical protein KAH33_03550 [Candidatus Delongbacteria bacterium]|nr:hypothetical protein [Candidatus Delongbacteria bacterium]